MTDHTNGTAATSPKPANATSQCPYAAGLSEDELSHTSLLTAELSQCPAFNTALQKKDGSNKRTTSAEGGGSASKKPKCPFEGATSKEEVQKTLASIPKSHYTEHQSSFFQVMQHMHTVHEKQQQQQNSSGSPPMPPVFSDFAKSFGGQCPMQPYITSSNSGTKRMTTGKSFARAMEDCSMAAIMARLVEDMQEGDDSQRSNDDDDDMAMTPRNADAAISEQKSPATGGAATTFDAAATQPHLNKNPHSLAEALKTGTAVSHQAAEDVHFVKNFISGKIDRHLYQEMIMGLYHVYVALEDALDQHAATAFPSCHFPRELRRREALQDDVEFWHNTRKPSPRTISPATQDYMDRIQYLASPDGDPLLLLAHSYTRYLGDLSGGRILARVARKALDLDKDSGEGLAFYRFEKVESYKQFKDNYRQALDALPLTPQQIQALVAEANVAFCFNMRLFQELDVMATIPGARVMSLDEVMEYADKGTAALEEAAVSGEDQCPFLVNKKKKEQEQSVDVAATKEKSGGRCPWPFIFAHDPSQGMRDWQTWLFVAFIVAWLKH